MYHQALLLFLLLASIVVARLSEDASGNYYLGPFSSNGDVYLDGDTYVGKTSPVDVIEELSKLEQVLLNADILNMQFLDSLRYQVLTNTPGYLEYFEVDSVPFVHVVNNAGGAQYLYKWENDKFVQKQMVTTPSVVKCITFTDGTLYLVCAYSDATKPTKVPFNTVTQTFSWLSAVDFGDRTNTKDLNYYYFEGIHFLGQTTTTNSYIFKMTGSTITQMLATGSTSSEIQFWTVDNNLWAAIVNPSSTFCSLRTYNSGTQQWVTSTSFSCSNPVAMEAFSSSSSNYIVEAGQNDIVNVRKIATGVSQWSIVQTFNAKGALDVQLFYIYDEIFLVVVNDYDIGDVNTQPSELLRWRPALQQFISIGTVSLQDTKDVRHFYIDGMDYLFVSAPSPTIYRLTLV